MPRRLAAIMFTDIAGYTALSQTDEPAALRLLQDQERLVRGLLEVHQGRWVKSMGDGLLLEFPDALDAVVCAVDLQRHIQELNAREPSPELRVRIGIHVGDVQGAGPDILGDSVNIASRIEPLADPGGVCVSAQVFDQVHNKIPYALEKLGPRTLKGIRESVEVYRMVLPWTLEAAPSQGSTPPRLAVLPLANISPDPKDEYFADGLTEELITILSQLGELQVIARTSIIQYKSAPKPIPQIGAELGVTSVLEGSVRKAGDQIRITVQLIDVASQSHTWASTYDRKLDDVFAIQTDVAKRIAEALKVRLGESEETRLDALPTVGSESYQAYLKGRAILSFIASEDQLRGAKKQFELAIAADPTNARAHAVLAQVLYNLGWFYYDDRGSEWEAGIRTHAARALELDPGLAEGHCSLAYILWYAHEFDAAAKELRLAISLNPSLSSAHHLYALLLEDEGRVSEALEELAIAEALDPRSGTVLASHAQLLVMLRRLEEAKTRIDKLRELDTTGREFHWVFFRYFLAKSDFKEALREADLAAAVMHRGPTANHAAIYALAGESERARSLLKELAQQPEKIAPAYGLAAAYAALGDIDECFRFLDKAFENDNIPFQMLRNAPEFEAVRCDLRFARLLKRMNLA